VDRFAFKTYTRERFIFYVGNGDIVPLRTLTPTADTVMSL